MPDQATDRESGHPLSSPDGDRNHRPGYSEMGFSSLLQAWPVVLLAMIVCAVSLALVGLAQGRVYTGTETILYSGNNSSNLLSGFSNDSSDVERNLATQEQVVLSDAVISEPAVTLGLSKHALRKATDVTTVATSDVLSISVEGSSPRQAVSRTKALSESYLNYTKKSARRTLSSQADSLTPSITRLRTQLSESRATSVGDSQAINSALSALLQRRISLSSAAEAETGAAKVLVEANVPDSQSSASIATDAIIGAGIGAVLGVGLVLWMDRRRGRPGH